MRIPVFAEDLVGGGFSKIAKKLRRTWPGPGSVNLSYTQQFLSQALGYRDLHDLQRSVELDQSVMSSIEWQDVSHKLTQSILAAIQDTANGLIAEYGDLSQYVSTLPIGSLKAVKGHSFARENPAELEMLRERPQSPIHLESQSPEAPSVRTKPSKPPITPFPPEIVDTIQSLLKEAGSLLDQCLFEMMLSGLSANYFLSLKVPLLPDTSGERCAGLLSAYVQESGLSAGDYLFPSDSGSGEHMTVHELHARVLFWLLPENPFPELLSKVAVHTEISKTLLHDARALEEFYVKVWQAKD